MQDGRIDGAVKVGNTWNIPINANKPADKRNIKLEKKNFIINLDDEYFNEVDKLKEQLDNKKPLPKGSLKSFKIKTLEFVNTQSEIIH